MQLRENPELILNYLHRLVGVEGFHKLIFSHDCTTALVISYAGFLSCCATGLFLDAWPPLCIFTVGQQMFSWVSPVFWAIYSASSLGDEGQHPHKSTIGQLMTHCVGIIICGLWAGSGCKYLSHLCLLISWLYSVLEITTRSKKKRDVKKLFPTIPVVINKLKLFYVYS